MRHSESETRPVRARQRPPVPILRPDANCWKIVQAERLAPLVDFEDYYRVAREAMLKARHSILLVGWTFDPRAKLLRGEEEREAVDTIGDVLTRAARQTPGLDVRVLIWNMPLPYALRNDLFPQRARWWFDERLVKFRLDPCDHLGASYHQKILVIDDAVAFCGGGDFVTGRWDTTAHLDHDPRRTDPSGNTYPARHDVMLAVAGPAAAALGDVARDRWFRATGERLAPPPPVPVASAWPEACETKLSDVTVGISRTAPSSRHGEAIRENEALYLDSIAAARTLIFLENQYFTAPGIGAALAQRLEERDGPEVIVICTHRSPGFLDGLCMDAARDVLIARLRQSDRYDRLHVYSPRTRQGHDIIVHSKLAIIDDRLLRVGSCNMANRSMGFDMECDIALAASDGAAGRAERSLIRDLRNGLVGHYLEAGADAVSSAVRSAGSVAGAIEILDRGPSRRLRRLTPRRLGPAGRMIARYHLGDPEGAADAWRPWRRRSLSEAFDAALATRRSTTSGR